MFNTNCIPQATTEFQSLTPCAHETNEITTTNNTNVEIHRRTLLKSRSKILQTTTE